jgi:prevent-host-death family protein
MAQSIPQRTLRNENSKVIEAVAAGQTFVVTRNGEPVAELRPIIQERPTYVARVELLKFVGVGPSIDFAQFRDDLDRALDPYV